MGLHKIRTTLNPGDVLTVGDAELLDLTRQGLVLEEGAVEKIENGEVATAARAESAGAAGGKEK